MNKYGTIGVLGGVGIGVALVLLLGLVYWLGGGAKLSAASPASTMSNGQPAQTLNIAGSASATGACPNPLSTAQTAVVQTFDADKPSTALTPAPTIYIDPSLGQVSGGNLTTTPGASYTAYFVHSGYMRALVPFTTPCNSASPQVTGLEENYDSAPTMTIYNVGGRTTNSYAASQSLTAASTTTIRFEVQPSALYKHIAGGIPVSQGVGNFAVFLNFTNTTDFDTSGFNLAMNPPNIGPTGAPTWGGVCKPYSGPTPSGIAGVIVYGWICTGDFTGKDTAIYGMDLTLKASATYQAGNRSAFLNVAPVDYFQNSVTGAVQVGPVTDTGATIQTFSTKLIALN